jgi:hypothetical protein
MVRNETYNTIKSTRADSLLSVKDMSDRVISQSLKLIRNSNKNVERHTMAALKNCQEFINKIKNEKLYDNKSTKSIGAANSKVLDLLEDIALELKNITSNQGLTMPQDAGYDAKKSLHGLQEIICDCLLSHQRKISPRLR